MGRFYPCPSHHYITADPEKVQEKNIYSLRLSLIEGNCDPYTNNFDGGFFSVYDLTCDT